MDFPKHIIEELLIRLPLNSIIKFKCVSKEWNNLISDTRFRKRYQCLHRNSCASGFLYHERNPHYSRGNGPCMAVCGQAKFINTSNIESEALRSLDGLQKIGYIVGSSKGLVLLSRNPMSYYVYDVLTKKHVQLPKTLKKYTNVCTGFICYECEENCLNNDSTNSSYLQYKVVRVGLTPRLGKGTIYNVETYSSEIGKWRKSKLTSSFTFRLTPQGSAKLIGGVLHWRNTMSEAFTAYDPENPKGNVTIIEYPVPNSARTVTGTPEGGLLCINESIYDIEVWGLGRKFEGRSYLDREYICCTQWALFHRVSLVDVGLNDTYFSKFTIDILPHDSNVIFLQSSTEIFSYNLKKKRTETILPKEEGQKPYIVADIYMHFELPSWPCL